MTVTIRKFQKSDVPDKVRWINDPENNRYLHYDLPLEIGKTEKWFDGIADRTDRFDAVILADDRPCGLIGLLNIDRKNLKAEYYITLGEHDLKGKGIAKKASVLLLEHAFNVLGLSRVYLFTESENTRAQHLFETLSFEREGLLRQDLISRGKSVDRYEYAILRSGFNKDEI
jgi:RimJ/RimL family protein N-acetyltransferase